MFILSKVLWFQYVTNMEIIKKLIQTLLLECINNQILLIARELYVVTYDGAW